MTEVGVWRRILPPLLVSRLLVGFGLLAALWFGSSVAGVSVLDTLHRAFYGWDAQSYTAIATGGYPTTPDPRFVAALAAGNYSPHLNNLDAFLPGYPLMIRLASIFFGGDAVVAGMAVSFVAEAIGLYYIYRLILAERDGRAASYAVWAMALAPFAVFMSAVYTESMFIAAAAAALFYMRAGRWREASLATAIACSTRITGVALLLALLIEYVRQSGITINRKTFWLLVAPLPLVAYAAYMQVHAGDALAMLHANTVFYNHQFALPWDGFWSTWNNAMHHGIFQFSFAYEVAFGVAGIGACIAAWTFDCPRSFAAYATVVVGLALCIDFWRSVPRYELALFPLIILVSDATAKRREFAGVLLGASAVAFVWGALTYTQGYWLA